MNVFKKILANDKKADAPKSKDVDNDAFKKTQVLEKHRFRVSHLFRKDGEARAAKEKHPERQEHVLMRSNLGEVDLESSNVSESLFVLREQLLHDKLRSPQIALSLSQFELPGKRLKRTIRISSQDVIEDISDVPAFYGLKYTGFASGRRMQSLYLATYTSRTHDLWIQAFNAAIARTITSDSLQLTTGNDETLLGGSGVRHIAERDNQIEAEGYSSHRHDKCVKANTETYSPSRFNPFEDNSSPSYSARDVFKEIWGQNDHPHNQVFTANIATSNEVNGTDYVHHNQASALCQWPRHVAAPSMLYDRQSCLRDQSRRTELEGQIYYLNHRYSPLKVIGTGAYGCVIAAFDSKRNENIAIKKIANVFDDLVDAKRILREIRLLSHFSHKNITKMLDLDASIPRIEVTDIYIITELMETDLHQVIYSMQPLSLDHIKFFLYQMLCALYHIHSAGVIHRDMKPSNILLNAKCDLKICDFGLARGEQNEIEAELTEYVVTRWYRAPEIMLNCLEYTSAVDVWSVGCIFAEMLLRKPLFPGDNYIHQLVLIIKVLGTPRQEDIDFVRSAKALQFLSKLRPSKPIKLETLFADNTLDPLAMDLLEKMLIFNPENRITVKEALEHAFLAEFYEADEIFGAEKMDFRFDIPDCDLTRENVMDLFLQDLARSWENQ